MASYTATTRFMVISDTHDFKFGQAEKVGGKFCQPAPKCDVLLHCGDLTLDGDAESLKDSLRMLGSIKAELKLVIAGNHDMTLDCKYWRGRYPKFPEDHEEAMKVMKEQGATDAGITYLEEGLSSYTLKSGAKFTIYVSPYTPEYCGWAFPYERDQDRFNLAEKVTPGATSIAQTPIPDFPDVDIIMTHGPPKGIFDGTKSGLAGCDNLMRAISRAKPLMHCFGHIHEGYGAELVTWNEGKKLFGADAIQKESVQKNSYPEASKWPIKHGEETLMVNAAINNVNYRPVNSPWLIDLELQTWLS
ncbi:hypothetical protein G7Y89_g15049 [Cudoniella acicularis]|uniref:Calcineurin-like phosphoesterase domain-containing protein n=1 Tax=Cudoniella acicularis TaxID=354080 RepID=A0A8H4VQY4_9HELO|nr:hypothetical protein G7Y89_g15049 [Cudoniella acicularis]